MFVIAVILMIVSVLLFLGAIFGGGAPARIDLGFLDLDINSITVFLLGMLTLLLFVVALSLFRSAARRANARRHDRKRVSKLNRELDSYRRQEAHRGAEDDHAGHAGHSGHTDTTTDHGATRE